MKNDVHPLRVLLKAIFLFIAFNVFFALVNPPIGRLTLYNSILPGRLRFPYEGKASFDFVGYDIPVFEDFDAMFGTHIISNKKPSNEYRVILLGDSTAWGFGLPADQTLSEQINHLHVQTCDGRAVHVYNLAYPFSYLRRDLLILDKTMEYQPDMVVWLITLSTLEPKKDETSFIVLQSDRYLRLAEAYRIKSANFSQPIREPSFWDRTIIGQRRRLKDIVLTQAFGAVWAATNADNGQSLQSEAGVPNPDVPNDLNYIGRSPDQSSSIFNSLMMDVLSGAYQVAGDVPIVLVNEPIFVATGKNHLIRYNGFYPRWVYDQYRLFLAKWTEEHHHALLDYWNALPPEDFSDRYFHRKLAGEQRFAELLAPNLKKLACPQ